MKAKKEKLYAVDAYVTFAKCFRVKAASKDEALKKVEEILERLYRSTEDEDASLLEELGFHFADETETHVSGEEGENGEIEYY